MSRRRRSRRSAELLICVLVGLLTACAGQTGTAGAPPTSVSATPTPAPSTTPTPVPQAIPCPGDTTSPAPPWATQANTLVTAYPERAEEIYKAALAKNPQEACAISGLGAVSRRQADLDAVKKAEEKAEQTSSPAERAGRNWTETTTEWVTPLGSLLATGAAALLLLLVLGRLFTPWTVPPSAVGPSPRTCTVLWWIALGVTVAGVVVAAGATARLGLTVFAVKPARWYTIGGSAAALVLLAGVVTAATRLPKPPVPRRLAPGRGPWGYGPALMLTVSGCALLAALGDRLPALLLGVAMGIVGTAVLATIQALLLRLTVVVNGSSGTADAQQAAYLLSRLNDLGSRPPSGLKVPEQTDVTALPAEALTSLPQGKLATVLFTLVRALLPPTPWRAVVIVHDPRLVSVTLSRNGRATGRSIRVAAADLGETGGKDLLGAAPTKAADDAVVTRRLLTAAAAHVLLELSDRHGSLRRGLCGTTSWRSLALHSIATDHQSDLPVEQQKQLVELAVADDPGNALARVARLAYRTVDDPAALVRDVDEEIGRIRSGQVDVGGVGAWTAGAGEDEGWEPLLLRLRFQKAAATLNAYLEDAREEMNISQAVAAVIAILPALGQPAPTIVRDGRLHTACAASEKLVSEVEIAETDADRLRMRVLLCEVRQATFYLVLTLDWLSRNTYADACAARCRSRTEDLVERTRRWGRRGGLLPGRPAYDRACWLCTEKPDETWQDKALADLRTAVAAQARLRAWAPVDPSLQPLRNHTDRSVVAEFWQIVGKPPVTALLDLPVFQGHRKALQKLDLVDPAEIACAGRRTLRRATGAPFGTVALWQDVARLAMPDGELKAVPIEWLDAVVALGVRSRADLLLWKREPHWKTWNDDVLKKVADDGVALASLPEPADWDGCTTVSNPES